ncbi:hypothetical protein [Sphingomonas sp. 3-13AW]|uniref:hypothetical protein n=1 Tax=Sphingomonas sp. 3-13AW TaxID=3050450 RepID=UPI003BB6A100
MIAFALLLIASQAGPTVLAEQQPDQTILVNKLPKGSDWRDQGAVARRLHAEASVQALKLNPYFSGCSQLTPEAFEKAFAEEVDKSPASPTMTAAALAAYAVCPTGGQ